MVDKLTKHITELQRRVRDRREPPRPNEIDNLLYNAVGDGLTTPVILGHVKNKPQVVHGQRALSKQVPPHLRRVTHDWDIAVTKNALENADVLEDKLDKIFGKDMFYVRVMYAGYDTILFRVMSRADRRPIVDYVAEKKLPENIIVNGVRYEILRVLRERAFKILRDKKLKFKHGKARDDVRRIDAAMRHKQGGIIPW